MNQPLLNEIMKCHNNFFCYSFALALAITIFAGDANAADTNHLVLITTRARQSGEVVVNGFPLVQLTSSNSVTITTFAEPFLVSGTNKLTLRFSDPTNNFTNLQSATATLYLDYGPEPNTEGQINRTNIFRMNRLIEPEGNDLIEETEFKSLEGFRFMTRGYLQTQRTFQTIQVNARKVEYSFLTNGELNITELYAVLHQPKLESLPWQTAPVALTEAERANIKSLVRSFHTALSNRNFESAANLLDLRLQRLATAFGTTVAEQRQNLLGSYTNVFGEGFQLDALDETKLQFKDFSPANLVQVLSEGKHPIAGRAPEYGYQVPVYVSNVNGNWKIVE